MISSALQAQPPYTDAVTDKVISTLPTSELRIDYFSYFPDLTCVVY